MYIKFIKLLVISALILPSAALFGKAEGLYQSTFSDLKLKPSESMIVDKQGNKLKFSDIGNFNEPILDDNIGEIIIVPSTNYDLVTFDKSLTLISGEPYQLIPAPAESVLLEFKNSAHLRYLNGNFNIFRIDSNIEKPSLKTSISEALNSLNDDLNKELSYENSIGDAPSLLTDIFSYRELFNHLTSSNIDENNELSLNIRQNIDKKINKKLDKLFDIVTELERRNETDYSLIDRFNKTNEKLLKSSQKLSKEINNEV